MAPVSSERAREREVHRYYQTWLESSLGYNAAERDNSARYHLDGSVLRASNDQALIAFAQLGCLRLNAKRGVVTLISSDRQYILAEATKTLSLITQLAGGDQKDELWFGNASLPRSQGVSGDALDPPIYTAYNERGTPVTVPALVMGDITKVDKYKGRAYAGNGVTFYCGVPITTQSGYPIGVYTVTDDKPRDGLTPAEVLFMQDMAQIVMKHLETVKNDVARSRGEKMVVALGDFIQGKTSTRSPSEGDASASALSPQVEIDLSSGVLMNLTRTFKGMTITDADPRILREVEISRDSVKPKLSRRKSSPHSPRNFPSMQDANVTIQPLLDENKNSSADEEHDHTETSNLRKSKIEQIFARAANIIRESTAADGVVFFDAASTNFAKRSDISAFGPDETHLKVTRSSNSDDSNSGMAEENSSSAATDSNDSMDDRSRIFRMKGKKCAMLGYALDVSLQSTANFNTINTLALTERSLRRFLKRYPRGKTFHYNAEGPLTNSEGDSSDPPLTISSSPRTLDKAFNNKSRKRSTFAIAHELIRVIPGARNVVWLPLWDFSKQRWCAGMLLWSRRPNRLLAAQEDLSYLKTFGSSIMIEVSRTDAHFADEAKSTFIANISHELRSPLHGILGSVEFLQETSLDAFQSSMTLAAETCAKTLLDTVEHVLDYAKINQMSAKSAKRARTQNSAIIEGNGSISTLDDDFDLACVVEEAVEAVYAGQTFRNPALFHKQDAPITGAETTSEDSDDTRIAKIQRASTKFSGAVRIILKIEKLDNWWTHTQAGAIRRVVMNILGNALKYTEQGTVMLSLVSVKDRSPATTDNRTICLTVKDTGRGMSESFLHNHAFTPFSQESQFSVGTGLGLSIVRQIVDALGGKIDLQSQKGVGTEVKVTFSVPVVKHPAVMDIAETTMSAVTSKTAKMSMCIVDPGPEFHHDPGANLPRESVESALQGLAETWFGMKVIKATNFDDVTTDFFVYAEPPPIEYLLKHHGSHTRVAEVPVIIMATNAFESASLAANGINKLTDLGRILEIISQPCGPQKFAKAVHRCLLRLEALVKNPQKFSEGQAVELGVSDKPSSELGPGDSSAFTKPSYLQHEDPPQVRLEESHARNGSQHTVSSPNTEQASEKGLSVSVTPRPSTGSRNSSYGFSTPASISPAPETTDSNPSALVVDDNDINLNLLVAFMKKAKYQYEKAKDGLQAVKTYEKAHQTSSTSFKYILMDISMPVMDGITATRKIREYERKRNIKEPAVIIALTGLGSQSTQDEMFAAGADYYLAKPVKFKELMELFRSHTTSADGKVS